MFFNSFIRFFLGTNMPLKSLECLGGIIMNGMPESLQNMKERIRHSRSGLSFASF